MPGVSFFQYADVQARVRARLGAMPDEAGWRYLADAADLDNLIDRMRLSGLAHWVADLPRSPDTGTIEQRLHHHLLDMLDFGARLLPGRWAAAKRQLAMAGNLLLAQRLLFDADMAAPERIDAVLKPLLSMPTELRRQQLLETRYQRYLSAPSPLERWLVDFIGACPPLSGREAYVVRRLEKGIRRHRLRIGELRRQLIDGDSPDPAAQWRLRDELALDLRALIGGDPFHAGLVLIYCLLELLQFERCRALLVAQSRGWERPLLPGRAA